MSYFDLSKLKISEILEDNYKTILEEYKNFNFDYTDFFSCLKIDKNFQRWKGLYESSLKIDEKYSNVFLGSSVESQQKKCNHYELEVNQQVIWEGVILSTKKNFLWFEYLSLTAAGKKFFPKTVSLLKKCKEVTTISIARFPSKQIIPPHKGNKNIIRIHFGLDVPEGDIGFYVKGVKRKWVNGKCFAFNDFFEHGGWNNTEKDRIILIVDLDRKLTINKNT